ncbi:hypothetical protein M407DRAFT_26130 [Tulasnella calospora MUT 4182]|uniref:Uncharacterized protein n=1 Tax=Tulasnella calospora MUT 4182 TaxID=1051891 RepID=A0A0C3QER2_9AGAM|nr:hypothetical protein M407DRAFT_26130 [Tulasnella calospora MUT 4182]
MDEEGDEFTQTAPPAQTAIRQLRGRTTPALAPAPAPAARGRAKGRQGRSVIKVPPAASSSRPTTSDRAANAAKELAATKRILAEGAANSLL